MLGVMTESEVAVHKETVWEYDKGREMYVASKTIVEPYVGEVEECAPAAAVVAAGLTVKAGIAMTVTSSLLGGMMIAGGVLSGLGVLTGNKALTTIGGGLSLASGIGSAFTNAATGEFINPFKDGNFGKTMMGKGLESLKNDLGFGDEAAQTVGQNTTQNIVEAAQGGDAYSLTGDAAKGTLAPDFTPNPIDSAVNDAVGRTYPDFAGAGSAPSSETGQVYPDYSPEASEIVKQAGGGGYDPTATQNQGGGIGSAINKVGDIVQNKGLMGALGGINDAYNSYENREMVRPVYEGRADLLEEQTRGQAITNDLALARQENMDISGIDATGGYRNVRSTNGFSNRDARQRTDAQQQPQRYVMYVNNKPVYVTEEEYIQMQQQRNQPTNNGGLMMA